MITYERLHELLEYNPNDGLFRWKVRRGGTAIKGSIAGCKSDRDYILIGVDDKLYQAHRLAFLYMEGYLPENYIDHINGARDDNRWENLREVTHSCNLRNTGIKRNNISGVTGVRKTYYKWIAQIGDSKGGLVYLGRFEQDQKDLAVLARWQGEVEYGYPNCQTTSTAYLYLKGRGYNLK